MRPENGGSILNIPSLDGIRAVSVIIVLLSHTGYGSIIPGGLGVTIFFFLSGYLITTLLIAEHERTGTISISQFYLRRILRLFPALMITLAIAYALVLVGLLSGGITASGLLAQIFYIANYHAIFLDNGQAIPTGTQVIWSLAVEEHYYIVFPFVMLALLNARLSGKDIGIILGAICVLILAWRAYLVLVAGVDEMRTYYGSDTRIDSIIYGCLLAILANPARCSAPSHGMGLRQWAIVAGATTLLLTTLLVRHPAFRETIRYSMQGLALMPLFYFAIRYPEQAPFRFLNLPWVSKIGVYSYAIYLIHHVAINVMIENSLWLSQHSILLSLCALAVSVGYAALLDRTIDAYFRKFRSRFRAAAPLSPAVARRTA